MGVFFQYRVTETTIAIRSQRLNYSSANNNNNMKNNDNNNKTNTSNNIRNNTSSVSPLRSAMGCCASGVQQPGDPAQRAKVRASGKVFEGLCSGLQGSIGS